jgi:hypothetical protein
MPGIPTTHGEKADNTAESTAQSRQAALRRWDLEGEISTARLAACAIFFGSSLRMDGGARLEINIMREREKHEKKEQN